MTGNCRPVAEQFVAFAEGAEKVVRFAPGARDSGTMDVPDPTSHEPLVDTSRIPSVAGRGAPSISGFPAAPNEYTVIDSGELWLRVQ